jgi:diguanylate cyclase (GGDEF)-like protein
MVLDLDGFKAVNDTLGHDRGDRLLTEVATRLAAAVGPDGVVARLGGDEFAVLLPGDDDVADRAVAVGRRVLAALDLPVDLDGTPARVGGSLGVSLAPEHGTDASTLLRCADTAMYRAKTAAAGLHLHAAEDEAAARP